MGEMIFPRPKVAFVLSGGAALGASQIGMLRALLERDIFPDLIVGTSIGAWNGVWLAAHPDLASLAGLERVWRKITLMEVFGGNVVNVLQNIASKRPYLVADDGMRHIYQRAVAEGQLDDLTFAKLKISMKIAATNILRGESEIFDEGPIEPALFASSAIPGLFPPVMIGDQQYVDGGLLDNGGVGVAVEAGAETIYVLNVMAADTAIKPAASLTDVLVRSFQLAAASHVRAALRRYARQAEFIVIEDETTGKYSALDFRHTDELIRTGYEAAARKLDGHERWVEARAVAQARHDAGVAALLAQPSTQAVLRALAWADVRLHQRFATAQEQWIRLSPPALTMPSLAMPDFSEWPKMARSSSRRLASLVGVKLPDAQEGDALGDQMTA